MKITQTDQPVDQVPADAVVIGIWKDEPLDAHAQKIDQQSGGALTRLIKSEDVSARENSVTTMMAVGQIAAPVVAVVGLGEKAKAKPWLAFRAAGSAAKNLATKKRNRVAFFLDVQPTESGICGSFVGCQGQDIYREEPKLFPFGEVLWANASQESIGRGEIAGQAMNLTRRLVNEPPNKIYPESFADQCHSIGAEAGFAVETWDEQKLADEKCGSLLAVAQGSDRPPRLVIMRYQGAAADSPALALVGKGVTFDSGGLSLKPSESMLDMKCDMAGAATVLGAMQAIAASKLPINVTGLVGLVENMVSGRSYKLGDVITARSGKTIEVHNTDAEGRLVLADVLDVALSSGASKIVDLATLTGACMVALGKNTVGVMTNNEDWCQEVMTAAQQCGEPAWQLPMFEEFGKQIQSKVADIKNVGEGRWGGAMTAAKLLEEFVGETPWVHLDIAGPAFADKPHAWIDAGGSGCMVRTLVQLAESW